MRSGDIRTSGIVTTWRVEHVVLEVAAGEHLGEGVADEFGDALLALGRAGVGVEAFCHRSLPGLDRISGAYSGEADPVTGRGGTHR